MPEDVQRRAEEPPHAHGPEHAEVSHERTDARLSYVVWFAGVFIPAAILAHVVLWWLLGGLERHQETQEDRRGMRPPPIAREDRPRFPEYLPKLPAPPLQVADIEDMNEQRRREDAYLASYGWQNRAKGVVHIPIERALEIVADPARAKAHGITARPVKEAP